MNAEALLKLIIEYGADEDGIRDRFGDNVELYESCFHEFIEEQNFMLLKESMAKKDYDKAFSAAHALRGLSGNLGLTSFYDSISALVELLRRGDYSNIDKQYRDIQWKFEELKNISIGKSVKTKSAISKPVLEDPVITYDVEKEKKDLFIPISVCVVLAVILAIGFMFSAMLTSYKDNTLLGSSVHLIEMSNQLKLYVQNRIETDWKIVESVTDSIIRGNYEDDDEAMYKALASRKVIWNVTDLILYNEKGFAINADGEVQRNDMSSDTIVKAYKNGSNFGVAESNLVYTLPVQTDLKFAGSQIVAVSVVQSMGTFLDEMGFSSFEDKAWMYLTDENGIIISTLTNEHSIKAFNIKSILDGHVSKPLGDYSADSIYTSDEITSYLVDAQGLSTYVLSIPLKSMGSALRLYYLAPEDAVNSTMSNFSNQMMVFSISLITLFTISASMAFFLVYRSRKRLFDRALMARERMFDLLIKNTRAAFALLDANKHSPVYVSSNANKVVGDKHWILIKSGSRYHMRNDQNIETNAIKQVNKQMVSWDGASEFRSDYVKNDDESLPEYITLQLYPVDTSGKSFVGIVQDVTNDFERENATKIALEMAERSNAAKSKFLSNMSHDIRTPMNAIVNMTGFALESLNQPSRLSDYLSTIRESSDHLLRLINDVLDMSRIESGQTEIKTQAFNIVEELERQTDMIRPLTDAKHQMLITDFTKIKTTNVLGDQLKVSQIVMNLLSNAVKFTPEMGAIRFSASEVPSLRDDIVSVHFTVEDNGIGMSEETLKHIFEPFARADDKRVSRIEGTGLGLSICHSYVTAMGGSIRCDSEEGEGSTFMVELFFQKSNVEVKKTTNIDKLNKAPFVGLHCLLAEDNNANQMIAVKMLTKLGLSIETTSDGRECLQKFKSSRPGTYDIIYMDIQMPIMDGYQATVAIRECEHMQAKTIPIVAMTANVFAEDIEKARIAGMNGHLGKPLMSLKIIEETYKVLNNVEDAR